MTRLPFVPHPSSFIPFFLDSWLLFYDATFRPRRFQQRLNDWLPPKKEGTDTSWSGAIILPKSWAAWRLISLCLPWWLAGVVLLGALGWPHFTLISLLVLSLVLLLYSWAMTIIWPSLGLLWSALSVVGLLIIPQWWPQVVGVWQEIWTRLPWLILLLTGLSLVLSTGLGMAGIYRTAAHNRRRRKYLLNLSLGNEIKSWLATRLFTVAILMCVVAGIVAGIVAVIVVVVVMGVMMIIVAFFTSGDYQKPENAVIAFVGVTVVLAVIVLGGVAVVVLGVMPGSAIVIVSGVTLTFVGVTVLGVMRGGVVGGMRGGVVGGVLVSVAGGVLVGMVGIATAPLSLAWLLFGLIAFSLGRWPRWWGGLLLIGVLAAIHWENLSWLDVVSTTIVVLFFYSRLPFNLLAWAGGRLVYHLTTIPVDFNILEKFGGQPLVLLRWLPPFSDETVWLPVSHLDSLLVAATRQDRTKGLELVTAVATSTYQKWAVGPAYAQITANTLAKCRRVENLPRVVKSITWLPDNLTVLGSDVAEVWPRLYAISQDVAVALDSTNPYTRRLGLDEALKSLGRLRQSLPAVGPTAVKRWQPVVDSWLKLLDEPLSYPLLPQGRQLLNPYDAGNPLSLSRAALFRGRETLRDTLMGALLEQNRPTLVLHGPRRMGKTSFLLQLPRLVSGSTLPVFMDVQRPGVTESTTDFLLTVAKAIVTEGRSQRRLNLPLLDRADFRQRPFSAFGDWLDGQLLPALESAGGFNILLCLDEFEKLGQAITANRVETRVLDEIRHTIQHRQTVSLLFAGVQTLEELGPNWSSYFINVRPLTISYLTPTEAADLIRNPDPASGFNLAWDDAAVANIIAVTRCHPLYVQLICSEVVNQVNQEHTLQATPMLVAQALQQALNTGEPFFRNIWDETTGLTPEMVAAGQAMLRQVAVAAQPVILNPDTLTAGQALERLVRYKVLEKVDDGYQFEVELVRRWVAEKAPQF